MNRFNSLKHVQHFVAQTLIKKNKLKKCLACYFLEHVQKKYKTLVGNE